MGNGIGFEHYFLNYYLYLPFSKTQEEMTIFESVKYLLDLNLITIKDEKGFQTIEKFFKELRDILLIMKKYSACEVEGIKNELYEINEEKRKIYTNEIHNIIKALQKFSDDGLKNKLDMTSQSIYNKNIKCEEKNDEIVKRIIYGDYINKNELVEVYLHQRTMKKVKYKKRDLSEIHQINLDKLDNIKSKLIDVYTQGNKEGEINTKNFF